MPTDKFSVPYTDLPPSVREALLQVIAHQKQFRRSTASFFPVALLIAPLPILFLKFESHNESLRKEYIGLFRALRLNINHPKIHELVEHVDAKFIVVNSDMSLGARKTLPKIRLPPFGYIPMPNPKEKAVSREWRKRKLVKRR